MVRSNKKPEYLKSVIGPSLGLLALLGIASYALLGPTGIIAWTDYRSALSERKVELAKLKLLEAKSKSTILNLAMYVGIGVAVVGVLWYFTSKEN